MACGSIEKMSEVVGCRSGVGVEGQHEGCFGLAERFVHSAGKADIFFQDPMRQAKPWRLVPSDGGDAFVGAGAIDDHELQGTVS
jgi:hypothetical protein